MLDEIPSTMVTEWLAWLAMEHLGESPEDRADLRTGIIASTIANVNRDKKTKALKPSDFMPKFEKPKQTPDQVRQSSDNLRSWFIAKANQGDGKRAPADGDSGKTVR